MSVWNNVEYYVKSGQKYYWYLESEKLMAETNNTHETNGNGSFKFSSEEFGESLNSLRDVVARANELIPKYSIARPEIDSHRKNIQAIMAASQQNQYVSEMRSVFDERREYEKKQLKASEETAANTAMTNERLNEIIDNQNKYIKILEDQIHDQKEQLEIAKLQLQALKNLFTSLEDGVSVEKELAGLIQSQIDETHPLWDYVKDKAGDIAVAGIIHGTPVLYNALKAYLMKNGIPIP